MEAWKLFEIMDEDDSGEISADEFVCSTEFGGCDIAFLLWSFDNSYEQWKILGLGYISGDYTTKLYADYNKPW